MAGVKKLRAGIMGCGGIAQLHAEVLAQQETAELVACADMRPAQAKAMSMRFGGHAYGSLEEMLDREELDIIHLCTPHPLHTPMAVTAAARGVHVFTEKPPVISHEQWEIFRRLEERVRIGVCFQNRYDPAVVLMRELLASGGFGAMLGARAFVTWRRDAPYYTGSGWRGSLETEGGGVLINQSIHTLDLLGQFLGRAESVEAGMSNRHLKGITQVEDTMEAYVRFSGATALFYATTAYCVDAPVLLELVCERAALRMEDREICVRWNDGGREHRTAPQPTSPRTGRPYWGASHERCIGEFYRSVLEGTPFAGDVAGVADTMELMLAMYDSARGGGEIRLP